MHIAKLHTLLGWPSILQSLYGAALHLHTLFGMCSMVKWPKCSPYIALGPSCHPGPKYSVLVGTDRLLSIVHDIALVSG